VGLDIGVSTLKVVELDYTPAGATLVALGVSATPEGVFEGSLVVDPKKLGRAIAELLESSGVSGRKVSVAIPGSSTFSKRLKMPSMPFRELSAAIRAEAINFIPDDVAAVNLDFHVIGKTGGKELEVLVIAVKEEVVEGFLTATREAGSSVEVVDVDCFALQNCFEAGDPSALHRTVGLIDVGSTVSSINICRGGNSIFSGDISIGVGRLFEDLARELALSWLQARDLACRNVSEEPIDSLAQSIIERNLETLALECSRQLSFYWKAAGTGESIDQLVLSGGGACVRGMSEKVTRRTGIDTVLLDPFRGIGVSPQVDRSSGALEPPMLGVAIGLALREREDRTQFDYEA